MSDVFYLRPIDGPIGPSDVRNMATEAGGCFNIHRVTWQQSFLASDGNRIMCWYRAPDAESARMALRQLGSDMTAVWAGSVLPTASETPATVLAEATLAAAVTPDEVQAACASAASDLAANHAHLVNAFLSNDGKRVVYAFAAPNAASVADALEQAGIATDAVWPCQVVMPN